MAEQYLEFEQDGVKYNLYDLPDGFVIRNTLKLENMGLEKLPDLSKVVIEGSFSCMSNKLTSLEGAPQSVGGFFNCSHNELADLKGAPPIVNAIFVCSSNKLVSLEGAPQTVSGSFCCDYNCLATLEGSPQEVGDNFVCTSNCLISLVGAPQAVKGHFYCFNNEELKSLFGIPALPADKKIHCDRALADKYGLSMEFADGIPYGDLFNSALYKSELAKHHIEMKRQQERKTGAPKVGSWYADFKKHTGQNTSDGRE